MDRNQYASCLQSCSGSRHEVAGITPWRLGRSAAQAYKLCGCIRQLHLSSLLTARLAPHSAPNPADEAEAAADDGIVRRSSLLERDGHDLQIRSQPSSAVPMPSAELASGTPPKQGTSPPPPAAATPPAAAPAAAVAAAEAAVLDAAVPQAEPSIEGAVSLAGIPPPPAPQPPSPKVRLHHALSIRTVQARSSVLPTCAGVGPLSAPSPVARLVRQAACDLAALCDLSECVLLWPASCQARHRQVG